jgi:hypothetical protein
MTCERLAADVLLVQPIAPGDVADILAGPPQGRYCGVAGPQTQDLVDMPPARRPGARTGL